jgi:hypothetical protein
VSFTWKCDESKAKQSKAWTKPGRQNWPTSSSSCSRTLFFAFQLMPRLCQLILGVCVCAGCVCPQPPLPPSAHLCARLANGLLVETSCLACRGAWCRVVSRGVKPESFPSGVQHVRGWESGWLSRHCCHWGHPTAFLPSTDDQGHCPVSYVSYYVRPAYLRSFACWALPRPFPLRQLV